MCQWRSLQGYNQMLVMVMVMVMVLEVTVLVMVWSHSDPQDDPRHWSIHMGGLRGTMIGSGLLRFVVVVYILRMGILFVEDWWWVIDHREYGNQYNHH